MTGITLISPAMEVHAEGCADIAREMRKGRTRHNGQAERAETFRGATALEAVRALDEELAGWFCETAYTDDAVAAGCWTTAQCTQAPCMTAVLKGLGFDPTSGEPSEAVGEPKEGTSVVTEPAKGPKGPRPCGCGCGEQTKGGTFRPGHDARFYAAKKRAEAPVVPGRKPGDNYSDRFDRVEDGYDHVARFRPLSGVCSICGDPIVKRAWTVPFHRTTP